ncbi:MAG: 5-methyltetrahydropteroyltriglutamate--homocysteine S-methyltransferase [Chthoniobacteraceae bacterium]
MKNIQTQNLGYPRIGEKRELKRAVEAFWQARLTEDELHAEAKRLRAYHWLKQREAGIDLIPSNDFSYYDQMLDTCALTGAVPARFGENGGKIDLATYFKMARGERAEDHGCACGHVPAMAMEMTKWFDTNYHYLVPELHPGMKFRLSSSKPFDEFSEALALGIRTKPVLIGPVTFLLLGKAKETANFDPLTLLDGLLPVYIEALHKLAALGAEWVQLDEPAMALDLTFEQRIALVQTYQRLASAVPQLKLMVASYFGELRENLTAFVSLPVAGLHFDAVRGEAELDALLKNFPAGKMLSLGVVDGRNVWRNDFEHSLGLLRKAVNVLGAERLVVAPSCSLLHSPATLSNEHAIDAGLKSWLAFADEKLAEVVQLSRLAGDHGNDTALAAFTENQAANNARRNSALIHNPVVKQRAASVQAADASRSAPFAVRKEKQQARLKLPLLPTTTIGSFPQTNEVRTARARFKKGEIDAQEYENFLEAETRRCVEFQEETGIDVLVHGEFERNDMVEYFGEQLDGFAFTENGWVQSYGSRCVKPPLIFGDVSRPAPMTVRWAKYAQSLTSRPMKGMLTGPVTVLQWSFVRNDQPRSETARQIALALRDEVVDLEAAGLAVIQIDEPALREGLPLRRADWPAYLTWGVNAFQLTAAGVRDETQIHTHMCYCEFNDIMQSIADLDADVISIETSRSAMELLEAFVDFRYPADIGPGVWDIHSPRVPSAEEMEALLQKALAVIPAAQIWVNPDCGLKTRRWEEVAPALKNLVQAAKRLRINLTKPLVTA